MRTEQIKQAGERTQIVRTMNDRLGHYIERSSDGYKLYDGFGYSGTFATEALAMTCYRQGWTNFDCSSTPDGI